MRFGKGGKPLSFQSIESFLKFIFKLENSVFLQKLANNFSYAGHWKSKGSRILIMRLPWYTIVSKITGFILHV